MPTTMPTFNTLMPMSMPKHAPLLPLVAHRMEAAIVDLDGTMVDTLGDFEQALNYTLTQLDLPSIDSTHIERMVGKGTEHLLRTVLAHALHQQHGAADAQREQAQVQALMPAAWEAYHHRYGQINGQYSRVYEGVASGLQGLQAMGLRLACLTNKPLALARPLLQAKGLDGFFAHVFGGDSFALKKPNPMPVLGTCQALGSAPARTLMVGDSSNDAQAARAAGCPVVLVTYGYNHGQPVRAVDADGWVDSLCEMLAR